MVRVALKRFDSILLVSRDGSPIRLICMILIPRVVQRFLGWTVAAIVTAVFVSSQTRALELPGPVVVATNEYPPYSSTHLKDARIVLDILETVFEKVGLPLEIWAVPWARGERMVLNGEIYAGVPYFKTLDRSKVHDFSDPIIYSKNRFFYHKQKNPNQPNWQTLQDFKDYSLGAVKGYWYVPEFERNKLNLTYVHSDRVGLKMIVRKRLDYLVVDEIVGYYLLAQEAPASLYQIGVLDKAESIAAFHLMVSRKFPNAKAITEEFNKGLKAIKDNGEYERIFKRYSVGEHLMVK